LPDRNELYEFVGARRIISQGQASRPQRDGTPRMARKCPELMEFDPFGAG